VQAALSACRTSERQREWRAATLAASPRAGVHDRTALAVQPRPLCIQGVYVHRLRHEWLTRSLERKCSLVAMPLAASRFTQRVGLQQQRLGLLERTCCVCTPSDGCKVVKELAGVAIWGKTCRLQPSIRLVTPGRRCTCACLHLSSQSTCAAICHLPSSLCAGSELQAASSGSAACTCSGERAQVQLQSIVRVGPGMYVKVKRELLSGK
jgi:hypothetical protein